MQLPAPVFISFSSRDESKARTLVEALERRGVRCWISFRDLPGGSIYMDRIWEAIQEASALVLVFSRNADASEEIKKEVELAKQRNLLIVPFFIEKVNPSRGFAFEIKIRQWVDGYSDWEAGVQRLIASLGSDAAPDLAPVEISHATALPPATRRFPLALTRPRVLVLAIALFGLLAAVVGGDRAGIFSKPPPFEAPTDKPPATRALVQKPPATPSLVQWTPLPPGTDFVNAGASNVAVYAEPDRRSRVLMPIGPGADLFLDGDPGKVESATIDGQPWLRFKTRVGSGHVLRAEMCAGGLQDQCKSNIVSPVAK
jgi:hypothetical protein